MVRSGIQSRYFNRVGADLSSSSSDLRRLRVLALVEAIAALAGVSKDYREEFTEEREREKEKERLRLPMATV